MKRLGEITLPQRKLQFELFGKDISKPYQGVIEESSFIIKRRITGRNSFLPKISGMITEKIDERNVTVEMKIPGFIKYFMIVWFSFIGIMAILFFSINDPINPWPAKLIPSGMLIFGYVMMMMAFKPESNRSKKDLQEIWEAEIVEES